MNAEQLYTELKREPFKPFRISLIDGRRYIIREPELVLVCESDFMVGLKPPTEKRPIFHQAEHLSISYLDRIDYLDEEADTSPRYNSVESDPCLAN